MLAHNKEKLGVLFKKKKTQLGRYIFTEKILNTHNALSM